MSASVKLQNVLITGGGGFIGSHLTEACIAAGHRVRVLLRYTSSSSRGWLDDPALDGRFESVAGDVRDADIVRRAVDGVDTVLHLAALIGIPYSYESPTAYVRTNVEGTLNVLTAARDAGVGNIVLTSTSETYGSAQRVPIDETHPAVAQSPYAATKVAADQLGISFHRSFGLPVKIVRPFNTYGPRQSLRAVIPTIISQLLSGPEVTLGNLRPTRDLTFVKDTVSGILAVAGADALWGEPVNIGMNQEISIGELAETIARLMGREIRFAHAAERQRPDASEVDRLVCDNRRLIQATGWQPAYTLERGLRETIEWFSRRGADRRASLYHR
jgi:NAD dependent epimerase/dehydratase